MPIVAYSQCLKLHDTTASSTLVSVLTHLMHLWCIINPLRMRSMATVFGVCYRPYCSSVGFCCPGWHQWNQFDAYNVVDFAKSRLFKSYSVVYVSDRHGRTVESHTLQSDWLDRDRRRLTMQTGRRPLELRVEVPWWVDQAYIASIVQARNASHGMLVHLYTHDFFKLYSLLATSKTISAHAM